MASIQILNDKTGQYYTVTVNISASLLSNGNGESEYYLTIATTMRKADGTVFPVYVVKTLNDVPPGSVGPAANFTELMQWYVDYFVDASAITQSSSSSTESEMSSLSTFIIDSSLSLSSISSISSVSSSFSSRSSNSSTRSSQSSQSSQSSNSSTPSTLSSESSLSTLP